MSATDTIISGLLKLYNARGAWYTVNLVIKDLLGNHLGYPINSQTKELLFWEKQMIGIGGISDKFKDKLDPQKQKSQFPNYLQPYIEEQHEKVGLIPRVLDVGAGPISLLAFAHHQSLIELTCADILANQYIKLLSAYGCTNAISGIKFIQTQAEDLSETKFGHKFDIVYCNNALDHTESPVVSLAKMTAITKSGGYIIISGRQREGTLEGWDGIHMHDIFIDKGILFREGKNESRKRLDAGLPLITHYVDTLSQDTFNDMLIIYRKDNDLH